MKIRPVGDKKFLEDWQTEDTRSGMTKVKYDFRHFKNEP